MSWREQLRPASFRGVSFFVDSDEANFGRRVALHEYPQRDKPMAEDMGRATRRYRVNAFVVGPDFIAARDKLLAAIEQEGAGLLVHPFYGELAVTAEECSVSHDKSAGGMAAISLTFVEAGELAYPQQTGRAGRRAGTAADVLSESAFKAFLKRFSVAALPQFVSDQALRDIQQVVDTAAEAMKYVQNPGALVGLLVDAGGLAAPNTLGAQLQGLFAAGSDLYRAADGLVGAARAVFFRDHASAALRLHSQLPSLPIVSRTRSSRQIVINQNAVRAVVRQQCLVQAAGCAVLMPAVVADDLLALRGQLQAAIDVELLTADDDVVVALIDLQAAAHKDLTERVKDSARLLTRVQTLPIAAAALAYDLYDDAHRADEIVARNRVRHPGFITGELQVLSK